MKVYIIDAAYTGLMRSPVKERDDLGKYIGGLAKSTNEPIFFHDYTDPVAGKPVIILECSEDFMEMVKKLPGFGAATEKPSSEPTARSAALWTYFTGEPATPARGGGTPPVKKPPRQFQL